MGRQRGPVSPDAWALPRGILLGRTEWLLSAVVRGRGTGSVVVCLRSRGKGKAWTKRPGCRPAGAVRGLAELSRGGLQRPWSDTCFTPSSCGSASPVGGGRPATSLPGVGTAVRRAAGCGVQGGWHPFRASLPPKSRLESPGLAFLLLPESPGPSAGLRTLKGRSSPLPTFSVGGVLAEMMLLLKPPFLKSLHRLNFRLS